jgi:hypothetical protein
VSRLRRIGQFWWAFVIGDDWRLALGGGCALGVTGALAATGIAAWWTTPLIVVALLIGTLTHSRPVKQSLISGPNLSSSPNEK